MVGFMTVVAVLAALLLLKHLYQFARNYVTAMKSGVPFIAVPVDQNHVLWMVSSVMLRPWISKTWPSALWERIKYSIYGWEYHEKLRPFHRVTSEALAAAKEYEKSFFLVTLGRFEFWTVDPVVSQQILLQPKDFLQLDLSALFIAQFGTNVLSANGEDWSRHRKVVASAVTERISPVVWAEGGKQTKAMLENICGNTGEKNGETRKFYDMVKSITINVLSKAGLGVERPWKPEEFLPPVKSTTQPSHGEHEVSYMDSIKLINDYMTGPLILPTKILRRWPSFLPDFTNLRRLGLAKAMFPAMTKEMLSEEETRLESKGNPSGAAKSNLLSMLVAASKDSDNSPDKVSHSKKLPALSDDELVSNLYLFTAAGYDTTASTIAFAVTVMMRYPRWQDWLIEEIDSLLKDDSLKYDVVGVPDYQAIFPKCTRIMAFMFEVLRLFPVLVHITKQTNTEQTLTTGKGHKFVLPGDTIIYINTVSLHLDPAVWRNLNLAPNDNDTYDEEEMPGRYAATPADYKLGGGKLGDEWRFRPTRWINTTSSNGQQSSTQTLFQPPRATFVPWSIGPRVCPGQRMAQVEFVVVVFTILSQYRLEAVPAKGESQTDLKKRLDLLFQHSISKLALEMDLFNKYEADDVKHASKGDGGRILGNGLQVRLIKR